MKSPEARAALAKQRAILRGRLRELRCQFGTPRLLPDVSSKRGKVPPPATAHDAVLDLWVEAAIAPPGRGHNGWACAARIVRDRRGLPVIGELRIFPNGPDPARSSPYQATPGRWQAEMDGMYATAPLGGISARLLRFKLRDFTSFLADVQRAVGSAVETDPESPFSAHTINQWLAGTASPKLVRRRRNQTKRGRPRMFSDLDLARFAEEYLSIIRTSDRSPLRVLCARHGLVYHGGRNRISLARQRGLLSEPPKRGAGGGNLTRKAVDLLANRDNEQSK